MISLQQIPQLSHDIGLHGVGSFTVSEPVLGKKYKIKNNPTSELLVSSPSALKRTGEGATGTQKIEMTGRQRIVDTPLQDGGLVDPLVACVFMLLSLNRAVASRTAPLFSAKLESAKPGRANATWHLALFAQLTPRAVQTSLSTKIKASLEGNARCRTCRLELGQSCFALSPARGTKKRLLCISSVGRAKTEELLVWVSCLDQYDSPVPSQNLSKTSIWWWRSEGRAFVQSCLFLFCFVLQFVPAQGRQKPPPPHETFERAFAPRRKCSSRCNVVMFCMKAPPFPLWCRNQTTLTRSTDGDWIGERERERETEMRIERGPRGIRSGENEVKQGEGDQKQESWTMSGLGG